MDPPIAGQFFNTFNDLFAAVQSHARQTGWAVVKTRASNRRADGNYYKYDLACDRGVDTHEMRSTGRRQASSRKEGCPWRGVAAARKSNGDRWKYVLRKQHLESQRCGAELVRLTNLRKEREEEKTLQALPTGAL